MIKFTCKTDLNRVFGFGCNMIFLKFVFVPQDYPVGVTNTVFSSSFLLTFPIAFLGIADRILKVGLKA